jgi:hydroxyacylglutathione hydrolase
VFEKVVDGILWIPGRDKFLPDSHVYVVGKPDSADFSLVECGLMDMADYKLEQLDAAGIPRKHVKRIIMTHTHLDHIGCLPEIARELPHAEVWVHKDEALPLERGDARIVFGNALFEQMVRSQFSIPDGHFQTTVHRKLEDGENLDLGGVTLKVIHLPGHSVGSIGLFNEEHRLLISGDTIYADGAIGRYDLVSANAGELKSSLETVAQLDVDILLPSHNRIVKGGAGPMIRQTVTQWGALLGG